MVSCSPIFLKRPDFCFPSQEQTNRLEHPRGVEFGRSHMAARKRKKGVVLETPLFLLFPSLPPELRLKIWRATIEYGRVLDIREGLRGKISNHTNIKPWMSLCPVPPLLHVNKEARKEGLRFYSPSFGKTNRGELVHLPKIYFCPELDIVHLGALERQRAFSSPNSYHLVITERAWVDDFRKIQRVAMAAKGVFELVHWKADCLANIKEALIIVENPGRQFRLGSTPRLSKYDGPKGIHEYQTALETQKNVLQYLKTRIAKNSSAGSETSSMRISLSHFVKADGDKWADDGRAAVYCRMNAGILDSASGALSTKWYQPHPSDRHL